MNATDILGNDAIHGAHYHLVLLVQPNAHRKRSYQEKKLTSAIHHHANCRPALPKAVDRVFRSMPLTDPQKDPALCSTNQGYQKSGYQSPD